MININIEGYGKEQATVEGTPRLAILVHSFCGLFLPFVSVGTVKFFLEDFPDFLNQVCAGQRPVCNWFLEIAFVCDVSMHVCMCVCVCVPPPPKAINN